jgi:hypothetical protein
MAISMVFMVKTVFRYPRRGTSLGMDIILEGPRPNADYLKLRLPHHELADWADFEPGRFVQMTLAKIESIESDGSKESK